MHKYLDAIFINRNYGLFMGGSFISATGSWFLTVTIGWLLWELGKSEFLLGVANFAQMGPLLLFGLLGGAVADRVDRRLLLMGTQAVAAITSVGLLLLSLSSLADESDVAGRNLLIGGILALLFVSGISQAFGWPAWSPFIADLVGSERLRAAVALNSARFNLTRIIGPSVAGILLARIGPPACLAVAACTQAGMLTTMKFIHPSPAPRAKAASWLDAIIEGLRCAWGTPSVRELMIVSAVIGTAVMPYTVFLPAYAQGVLYLGPEGLGLMFTCIGLGAITGAIISGTSVVTERPRPAQAVFASTTGVFLAAFSLSTDPVLSSATLFVVGLASIAYLSTANATVQLSVPREVVGRVIGLWVVVNSGTTPLGGVILGALAERIGLGITLAVASLVSVVVCVAVLARRRAAIPELEPTAALASYIPSPPHDST